MKVGRWGNWTEILLYFESSLPDWSSLVSSEDSALHTLCIWNFSYSVWFTSWATSQYNVPVGWAVSLTLWSFLKCQHLVTLSRMIISDKAWCDQQLLRLSLKNKKTGPCYDYTEKTKRMAMSPISPYIWKKQNLPNSNQSRFCQIYFAGNQHLGCDDEFRGVLWCHGGDWLVFGSPGLLLAHIQHRWISERRCSRVFKSSGSGKPRFEMWTHCLLDT